MDIENFVEKVSEAVKGYDWIKRLEIHRRTEIRVWLRLFLNDEFVETFHNSVTASTSYAYIEGGERVFGANNMRIGWHLHPYGNVAKHEPSQPITIEDFLKKMEEELNKNLSFKKKALPKKY
ncbi:MAG: hypothetical protein WA977_03145 [Halobacteriota archaeon]